jgi:hypothetical protein
MGVALLALLGTVLVLSLAPGSTRLSGRFGEVGGPGKMEFSRDRVYVTSLLGMTFAAEYEVDGDRVIIKGSGGSRVYTLHGDTLDGGVGLTFVRE